jgi:DNA invertase Pin-like site-specific DNA recombinase
MSTHDQAGSPERQLSQIEPYCTKHGYSITQKYQDLGMRGSDDSRPHFLALLRDAQAGLFDVIVVDEVSRLSRQKPLEFIVKVAYPLQEAGVVLESVAEGRQNWDQLVGMILLAVRQDKASEESATLGRRTATGMLRAAKEGKLFVGRAPYGYKYELDEHGHRVGYMLDDDEKVRVVRDIFDAYANRDLSLESIVQELNSRRVPPPSGSREWGKTTVHRILKNPVYAGNYVWGRVSQGRYYRCYSGEPLRTTRGSNKSERRPREDWIVLPGTHTAIVDPAAFDEIQERLASNRKRTSPSRKKGVYSLSQLLRCSHCGMPMYGTKVKGQPVYRCGGSMGSRKCAPRIVQEGVLLNKFVNVLRDTFLHPENKQRLLEEVLAQQACEAKGAGGIREELRKRFERLGGQIAKARKNLIFLDPENIEAAQFEIRRLEQEQTEVGRERERSSSQSPVENLRSLFENVEKFVTCVKSANAEEVRSVTREAIGSVDLCFDTVPKKMVTRYPLASGVIHLRSEAVCAGLSTSDPGAAH